MTDPIPLSLMLVTQPLLWAALAWRVVPPMGTGWLATGVVLNGLLVAFLIQHVLSGGAQVGLLWGLAGDLGIGLRLDGLTLLFVSLTLLIGATCLFQAQGYFRDQPAVRARLWPVIWALWGGLNLIWLAHDFLLLYIGMEAVAFCVIALIALSGEPASVRAAIRYLQAVMLGTLALLLGAGVHLVAHGSLALSLPQQTDHSAFAAVLAAALITAGLTYRAALFPLHSWLPPAHGSSYAPLSALLSALVTKASFYILARYWLDNDAAFASPLAAQLLGTLGALAILWGGWMAWRQVKLKMLVAYSSVNQVGYFFLLFPLITLTTPEVAQQARDGAMLQVISHALAKAALFMSAGNLVFAIASERVDGLAGVSRYLPVSLLSFGLAGVSLMGLPPSGGFIAKWTLLQASIGAGQWWWALVLVLGGFISAVYVFRVYRQTYLEGPAAEDFHYDRFTMEIAPLALAILAAGLGLLAAAPLALLEVTV